MTGGYANPFCRILQMYPFETRLATCRLWLIRLGTSSAASALALSMIPP